MSSSTKPLSAVHNLALLATDYARGDLTNQQTVLESKKQPHPLPKQKYKIKKIN
jgi:hypothetical protein